MYNFYYGTRATIRKDPLRFLLAVKRALPRFANSLPDSAFTHLFDLLSTTVTTRRPVFVETGVGSSTLLLIYFAMLRGGHVLSWDTNSAKASLVRQACADAIEPYFGLSISKHWTFVSSDSLSPHTGLPILPQLAKKVDLSVHDSDHTWATIKGEIEAVVPLLSDGAVVCVDDANQTSVHTYEPIINVTRRKLNLPPIQPLPGNQGVPHYEQIPVLLARHFSGVLLRRGDFDAYLKNDIYYAWYEVDRASMGEVGMERFKTLKGRFGAWQVTKRRREASRRVSKAK